MSAFRYAPKDAVPAAWGTARFFGSSGTWVAPADGWVTFVAIGAGGSGAAARGIGSGRLATGGAAGGTCIQRLYVRQGATYVVTVGAGGSAIVRSTDGAASGNAGGNTTIAGPNVSLVAFGGAGGVGATTSPAAGAVGGVAVGGDANLQGGNSGSITSTGGGSPLIATGGGAVTLFGVPYASASFNATANNLSGGGAGAGGSGGAIGTASAGGPSPGQNLLWSAFGIVLDGAFGASGVAGVAGGAGAGGGSGYNAGSGATTGGAGGIFAGGGGTYAANAATGGAGGLGAGGGAAVTANSSGADTATSGAGGAGAAIILWAGDAL